MSTLFKNFMQRNVTTDNNQCKNILFTTLVTVNISNVLTQAYIQYFCSLEHKFIQENFLRYCRYIQLLTDLVLLYLISKSISRLKYRKTCDHTVAINVIILLEKCDILFICVLLISFEIFLSNIPLNNFLKDQKNFLASCWRTFSSLVLRLSWKSAEGAAGISILTFRIHT